MTSKAKKNKVLTAQSSQMQLNRKQQLFNRKKIQFKQTKPVNLSEIFLQQIRLSKRSKKIKKILYTSRHNLKET